MEQQQAISLKATNAVKSMNLTADNIISQLNEIGQTPLVGSNSITLPLGAKGIFTFEDENSLNRKDNLTLRSVEGVTTEIRSASLYINGVFKTSEGLTKAGKFYLTSENKDIIMSLLQQGKKELTCSVGYWSETLKSSNGKLVRKFTTDEVVIPQEYQESETKGWFADNDGNVITNPLVSNP